MDDAVSVFRFMDAQDIADLERATGLFVAAEEDWNVEDYDAVVAYLRQKALVSPAATLKLLFGDRPDA